MLRPWEGTTDKSGVGRLEELVQDGGDAVHARSRNRLRLYEYGRTMAMPS